MKFLTLSTVLLILFATNSIAQSEIRLEPVFTSIAVTDLRVEGTNINKLLAQIAYKYNVPISLEITTNEDLLNGKSLAV